MSRNWLFATLSSVAGALWIVSPTFSVPETITISGFLEDEKGSPIEGFFAARIVFYPTEEAATPLKVYESTTELVAGIFSIEIMPTADIISLDEVWYALAIDTDNTGIDEMDFFERRFQITSVLFSLTVRPATFFATHGGHQAAGGTSRTPTKDALMEVAPFITPSGGVRFNRMIAFLAAHDGTEGCSFGIYDATGNAVIRSGRVIAGGLVLVDTDEVFLQPTTLYYTGWGCKGRGPLIKQAIVPDVPQVGRVGGVVNGIIPESIDPDRIGFAADVIPLSITLLHLPGSVFPSKGGKPKVTYISPDGLIDMDQAPN